MHLSLPGVGFIYYWDWGPNSGSNWLISSDAEGTNRGIESDNVETGSTNYTMCLNQVSILTLVHLRSS